VSPQFHVVHDDFFETVKEKDESKTSEWQRAAGLIDDQGDSINHETPMANFEDSFQRNQNESEQIENEQNLAENEIMQDDGNVPTLRRLRRSTRRRRMTQRMSESLKQQGRETSFASIDESVEMLHEADYRIQDSMTDPISFSGLIEKDTMYFHEEAMNAPDREEFIKAVVKEINDHIEGKHWEIIDETGVPEDANILDAVWSMKRKRDILTRKVYKWNARLNVHGGQQEYAVNFYETYAPVVTWYAIRLLFTLILLNNWFSRQIDFILAYPQADIEFDTYMRLPHGVTSTNGKSKVLKLIKNIYGQKQAGRVFFLYLKEKLKKLNYV